MLYCAFCGNRHPDLETANAFQRIKQNVIIAKFQLAYGLGGAIIVFLVLPVLLGGLGFVDTANKRFTITGEFIYWLSFGAWLLSMFKVPFAKKIAEKQYPEQTSAE